MIKIILKDFVLKVSYNRGAKFQNKGKPKNKKATFKMKIL